MEFTLPRHWWLLALRGVLAIAIGVLSFFLPYVLLWVVAMVFAAYALIIGVSAIVAALTAHGRDGPWWALLLLGLVDIAAAIVAIFWPEAMMFALLYLIAGWAVFSGVLEIVVAIRLRQYISNEWLMILSGVLSIVLGFALGMAPMVGLLVIAWWIAANWVAVGVVQLALAFRLRRLLTHRTPMGREAITVP